MPRGHTAVTAMAMAPASSRGQQGDRKRQADALSWPVWPTSSALWSGIGLDPAWPAA